MREKDRCGVLGSGGNVAPSPSQGPQGADWGGR